MAVLERAAGVNAHPPGADAEQRPTGESAVSGPAGASAHGSGLAKMTADLCSLRSTGIGSAEENIRRATRDMLRNGKFKPTGRSKPASEYLLGVARGGGSLPALTPPVDAANYISLKYLVPISLWDVDRAGTESFEFRSGQKGDAYIFNHAGHEIDLEDLLCGFAVSPDGTSLPIVNPVKDSMRTKLAPGSSRIALVAYVPTDEFDDRAVGAFFGDVTGIFREHAGFECTGHKRLDAGMDWVLA